MKPRTYQTEATDAAWKFICKLAGAALLVLPTGAGKSLIIGMICRLAVKTGGRVLVIAHRKELLEQNAEKIEHMVGSPVGIYCAGLKRKDTDNQIIVASIQSLFRNPEVVGKRDLIIVDEAHLISPEAGSSVRSATKSSRKLSSKKVTCRRSRPSRQRR